MISKSLRKVIILTRYKRWIPNNFLCILCHRCLMYSQVYLCQVPVTSQMKSTSATLILISGLCALLSLLLWSYQTHWPYPCFHQWPHQFTNHRGFNYTDGNHPIALGSTVMTAPVTAVQQPQYIITCRTVGVHTRYVNITTGPFAPAPCGARHPPTAGACHWATHSCEWQRASVRAHVPQATMTSPPPQHVRPSVCNACVSACIWTHVPIDIRKSPPRVLYPHRHGRNISSGLSRRRLW